MRRGTKNAKIAKATKSAGRRGKKVDWDNLPSAPTRRENCTHCSGWGHTVYINAKIRCGVCFGKGYLEVGRWQRSLGPRHIQGGGFFMSRGLLLGCGMVESW